MTLKCTYAVTPGLRFCLMNAPTKGFWNKISWVMRKETTRYYPSDRYRTRSM